MKEKKEEKKEVKKECASKKRKNGKCEALAEKVSNKFWIFLGLIIVLALIAFGVKYYYSVDGGDSDSIKYNNMTEGESVSIEFYVMSQCPYGTQVEDSIAPVLKLMGNSINLSIDYIASELGDGNFRSLHGQPEVDENIRQLCAIKYNPDEYMDFIICQNKDIRNADKTFEDCADSAGLDIESVKACAEGEEGAVLLSESSKRAQEREARGSPTIYINGEQYDGRRDTESFQSAICMEIDHPACSEMPPCSSDMDCPPKEGKIAKCMDAGTPEAKCSYVDPVKVYMVVLNDKECAACDTTRIIDITKQLFPGIVIEGIDISTEAGREVAEMYELTYVPAYIFTSDIEDTNTWQTNLQVRGAFEKVGENYKLMDAATGATHFIDKEAEAKFMQSIGITPGDNKPQVDFFIMSYCPYGNQAEELIEPVYDLLGDSAEFIPHYVIYSNYQGGGEDYCIDSESRYCSMHGVQEMRQGIREACVYKHIGTDKFFEFAIAMNTACSAGNADTCWKPVAEGMGIDTDMIEQCVDEEGEIIAEADLQLGNTLSVTGSPAVFIDGQRFNGERSEEGYKQALCAAFDNAPDECSEQLKGTAEATAPSGSCG